MVEALGLQFVVETNLENFKNTNGVKINYSNELIENAFQIKPHTVLFDHGIRDYHLEVSSHSVFYKIFMKSNSIDLPFDLLGASFWLLSRYEEYLPFKSDKHNRFSFRSSLAYQYDFLQLPLINLWLHEFKISFQKKFPGLLFKEHQYSFLSTIDIDNAYKYKYKGFVRLIAGLASDRSIKKIVERLRINFGFKPDPFDCYNFLIEQHKLVEIKPLFFILLGDYGPNDKNHSATDLRFQSLIKHIADYSFVGIHPSYGSNFSDKQVKVEINRLNNITHSNTTKSRQHFSMLKFPSTYQNLLQAGVNNDYSMGYTNINGFRASYCHPFKWYNLDIEATSSLTIHSFCISENSLLFQTKRDFNKMIIHSQTLINEVKKYKGQMISIFHNDNFNEELKTFYVEFLKAAH